jgi:hypothetical protein
MDPPLQRTFTDPVANVDARPASSHEPNSHSRRTSTMSIEEVTKGPGRALVQPPRGRDLFSSSLRSSTPTIPYRESEQRQSEQDEARAVRVAMEDLELAKEGKLFEAARDEAAELVYKHRNPDAPGGPNSAYPYPGLARKGSTQRSRSVEPKDQDLQRANSKIRKRHSIGSASAGSRSSSLQSNGSNSPVKEDFEIKNKSEEPSSLRKAINDLPNFGQRRKSSGSRRKISGSLFNDPNDKIYEEPEEETPVAPAHALPIGQGQPDDTIKYRSCNGEQAFRPLRDPEESSNSNAQRRLHAESYSTDACRSCQTRR